MAMLKEELGNVQPVENVGHCADSMEAECFAWLAVRRLRHLPTSLPETNGMQAAHVRRAAHFRLQIEITQIVVVEFGCQLA